MAAPLQKKVEFYSKFQSFLACQNSLFNQIKKLVGHCLENYRKNINSDRIICLRVITQAIFKNKYLYRGYTLEGCNLKTIRDVAFEKV